MALHDKFGDIGKSLAVESEDFAGSFRGGAFGSEGGSSVDENDLLGTMGIHGIELLDEQDLPSARETAFDSEMEAGEEVELDLAPGALDKTSDPVRLYLREMGTVPLLTRQGELEIAKRFERGHLKVLKAISRSTLVIEELIAVGNDLRRGVRSIKEIVVFDEEDVTDEVVAARCQATVRKIDEMAKHHKKAQGFAEKLAEIGREKKSKEFRRCWWNLSREKVKVSRTICGFKYTPAERKRLIEKVTKMAETMQAIE